jgi:hypothetical protein
MQEDLVRDELRAGTLKALPLVSGAERAAQIYLAFSDPEFPGRDARRLADIVKEKVKVA